MSEAFGRRGKVLVPLLCVLMVAAFTLAAWSFYNGHSQACRSQNAALNVIATLLVDARAQVDASPAVAPEDRHRADVFYTRELARIDAARC